MVVDAATLLFMAPTFAFVVFSLAIKGLELGWSKMIPELLSNVLTSCMGKVLTLFVSNALLKVVDIARHHHYLQTRGYNEDHEQGAAFIYEQSAGCYSKLGVRCECSHFLTTCY